MQTIIHKRVEECRAGTYNKLIGKVKSGWLVMGDVQFLEGYCLIYPDPVVPHLNAMSIVDRQVLMHEVGIVGDALLEVTDAVRINYEILGNLAPALHVHIFPRFASEEETLKTKPVWLYDWDAGPVFDVQQHSIIIDKLRAALQKKGLLD